MISSTIDPRESIKQPTKTASDATVKDEEPAKAEGPPGASGPLEKQSTVRVVCLIVSAFVAMFLVALDRTIISTV